MRESSKAALCGITAALSVVIMLVTYISPLLVYTAPPFAGVLLLVIIEEIGYKRAIATYASIGTLSLLFVADKEATVFFIFFFGYFPILRKYLTVKIKNKPVLFTLKLLIFNIALLASVFTCSYVFHIDYSEFSSSGTAMMILLFGMMNVVYLIYDFLLAKLLVLYDMKLKKELNKLFRR